MTELAPIDTPSSEVQAACGDAWPRLNGFATMLVEEGELRGLLGPREYPRLWSRHLLNSTAINACIPQGAKVADIGSGAGFPGIVLAITRPDVHVMLIESMERRTTWLTDVVDALQLTNVTVVNDRAENVHARFDVVTARAVAALVKLMPWAMPLVKVGGRFVALKGERAQAEVDDARAAGLFERYGCGDARVFLAEPIGGGEGTHVVEIDRVAVGTGAKAGGFKGGGAKGAGVKGRGARGGSRRGGGSRQASSKPKPQKD